MPARRGNAVMHVITKTAIGAGALFVVGVLLAAIPNHKSQVLAPNTASRSMQGAPDTTQNAADAAAPGHEQKKSGQRK